MEKITIRPTFGEGNTRIFYAYMGKEEKQVLAEALEKFSEEFVNNYPNHAKLIDDYHKSGDSSDLPRENIVLRMDYSVQENLVKAIVAVCRNRRHKELKSKKINHTG